MIRSTKELGAWKRPVLVELRKLAAAGATREQAARALALRKSIVDYHAHTYNIDFRRPARAVPRSVTTDQEQLETFARVRADAALELRREIALAKAEAPTAPIYKGREDGFR